MKGKLFLVASVMLIVNGYIQAQTAGRVPVFDQPGTGACNAAGGNDCVNSVITQDASGNIGIGTTTPAAKLDLAGGNVNLEDSSAMTGNILKGGTLFVHNFGPNNTFIGKNAGNLTMTSNENTAVGATALHYNTTGASNTAVGVNALQGNNSGVSNTASGWLALSSNTTGGSNTADGSGALLLNTSGSSNTAIGQIALRDNTFGDENTAIGYFANVSQGNLTNATAIGARAVVDASDKIRLGNTNVTVIEGQVPYTWTSDKNQKENFQPVDGEQVLSKIGDLSVTSWNYIGHDPKQFRHYGPVAQEFFAAFGHDAVGKIGTDKTINSGDMEGILMIAVQTLAKRNAELETRIDALQQAIKGLEVANRSGK